MGDLHPIELMKASKKYITDKIESGGYLIKGNKEIGVFYALLGRLETKQFAQVEHTQVMGKLLWFECSEY